jgi:hypothetical protein
MEAGGFRHGADFIAFRAETPQAAGAIKKPLKPIESQEL